MDNKKFEKLIDLIINENEDQARELFHEIIVEKSREIYESIMDEEMMMDDDMEEGMGGQVGRLMDEISAEESGVMEEEDEEEAEFDFTDVEDEGEEEAEEEGEEAADEDEDLSDEVHDLEDRVISVEDKLDELLAQFEKEMGGEEESSEEESSEEEAMMEAVELQKVSVTHGDNGSQPHSPTAFNSGKAGMDSKPVNFSGGGQEKGRSAPATKDVKGAGSFANAPGNKTRDLSKAPAPQKSQASGVNTTSPVAHK